MNTTPCNNTLEVFYRLPSYDQITLKCKEKNGQETTHKVDSNLLKKIPFFKICLESGLKESDSQEIFLPDLSFKDLELLFALFHEYIFLQDLVPEDFLTNPDFYDHLENQIRFFYLDGAENLILRIQKEINFLPYELAVSLYTNYKKKINETNKKIPHPFYIDTIRGILIQRIYYRNTEIFEKKYLHKNREQTRELLAKLKLLEAAQNEQTFRQQYHYSKNLEFTIKHQQREIKILENNLFSNLNNKKIKPSRLLNAAKFKASNYKFIKYYAKEANRLLKIYYQTVQNAIQYQACLTNESESEIILPQMHRLKMLNCLELFAYYNFIPAKDSRQFLFSNITSHANNCFKNIFNLQRINEHDWPPPCYPTFKRKFFYFNIKNENIQDFENEMRQKIVEAGIREESKLPPQLFKINSPFSTIKHAPPPFYKNKKLTRKVITYITRPKSQKKERKLKQELLEVWKWNKFGIKPEELDLHFLPKRTKKINVQRVSGTLKIFDIKLDFFFEINKLKPIIINKKILLTHKQTTLFIEKLYFKQLNSSILSPTTYDEVL